MCQLKERLETLREPSICYQCILQESSGLHVSTRNRFVITIARTTRITEELSEFFGAHKAFSECIGVLKRNLGDI